MDSKAIISRTGQSIITSAPKQRSFDSEHPSELILFEEQFSFTLKGPASQGFSISYSLDYTPRVLVTLNLTGGRSMRAPVGYGPSSTSVVVEVDTTPSYCLVTVGTLELNRSGSILVKVLASPV